MYPRIFFMFGKNRYFVIAFGVLACILFTLELTIIVTPLIYAQIPLIPGIKTPSSVSPMVTANVTTPAAASSITARTTAVSLNFSNATGAIASFQNNQIGKPHGTWAEQLSRNGIWLLSGKWTLDVPSRASGSQNTTAPTFDASFGMVLLNGTAMHKHRISDFKIIDNPITNSTDNSTTLRGTGTITLKDGPHTNVPISISIIGKSVIKIVIDPIKTDDHFGPTPIFGTVTKMTGSTK
ncbi:MAG: hypothetical protein M3P08_20315 [Thermoproteota archaeon]|nr:hypothetical protein [Thermoproteota archaeon]